MNTKIISNDLLYAEMLRLELERHGFDACVCSPSDEASSTELSAFLSIIDADSTDADKAEMLAKSAGAAIIFSRDVAMRAESEYNANIRRLYRPFPIGDFLCAADELAHLLRSNDRITVDRDRRTVVFRGECAVLTDREFAVFSILRERRGTPVSREQILFHLDKSGTKETNLVDVYVKYIRGKFETAFGQPMIKTVRGKGYMLP